jgi:Na+-translocating ferredoxin:NAD+ oxidoreductase RNF subunit RnfB
MFALAAILGTILSFAYSKLKIDEDPRKEQLLNLLPGVNCGACGAASCADFADKLINGEVDIARCRLSLRDENKVAKIKDLLKS